MSDSNAGTVEKPETETQTEKVAVRSGNVYFDVLSGIFADGFNPEKAGPQESKDYLWAASRIGIEVKSGPKFKGETGATLMVQIEQFAEQRKRLVQDLMQAVPILSRLPRGFNAPGGINPLNIGTVVFAGLTKATKADANVYDAEFKARHGG